MRKHATDANARAIANTTHHDYSTILNILHALDVALTPNPCQEPRPARMVPITSQHLCNCGSPTIDCECGTRHQIHHCPTCGTHRVVPQLAHDHCPPQTGPAP